MLEELNCTEPAESGLATGARTYIMDPEAGLPLVIQAKPGETLEQARAEIEQIVAEQLGRVGAVLVRGFAHGGIADFERFALWFTDRLLAYEYGSTPRTQLQGGIYTSTEYPSTETISLHNEMAYTARWPMKLWFYSDLVAQKGGATPIADSRRAYQRMPEAIRAKIAEKGVMYTRVYRKGLDVSWQKTFNTEDPAVAEQFCRDNGIEFEWRGAEFRTRQVCQGVAKHPVSGEMVWFNQAHLFHYSSMPVKFQEAMLSLFKEQDLPRNAFYGDGTPFEPETLETIRSVLLSTRTMFPWQQGDILMLDNMLVAHAREPFEGPRKVVVAMADDYAVGAQA